MGTPSSRDAGTLAVTLLRGRVIEMSRVDELIASAAAGAGGTVIVEGAAGIGKTRVLAEGCARARAAGLLVANGSADELDQVTPWRALLRAFGTTEPPLLRGICLHQAGGSCRPAAVCGGRDAGSAGGGQLPAAGLRRS